jgi:hypothetical protein
MLFLMLTSGPRRPRPLRHRPEQLETIASNLQKAFKQRKCLRALDTRPTLLPAVEGFQSLAVQVDWPTVDQQDDSSQPSSPDNLARDQNPITQQSIITTGEAAGMLACEREAQMVLLSFALLTQGR